MIQTYSRNYQETHFNAKRSRDDFSPYFFVTLTQDLIKVESCVAHQMLINVTILTKVKLT